MKIRNDFVTNSSSSSFVVEIGFELKDGRCLVFSGNGATGESGVIDYFEGDAIVTVSPRQLGMAKNIEDLIKLLTDGVISNDFNEEIKIFEKSRKIENDSGDEINDPYDFIKELRSEVKSIDEIQSITISGNEYNYIDYLRTYKYDCTTGEYICSIDGYEFEKDGASGGDLKFKDAFLAKKVSTKYDDEYDEDEYDEDEYDEDEYDEDEYDDEYCYGKTLTIDKLPTVVSLVDISDADKIQRVENVQVGDRLILKMDMENERYKPVGVEVFNTNNEALGYLKDWGEYKITSIARLIDEMDAFVESVTPLSKRRKNAKYALMDVKLVSKKNV